MRVRKPKAIEVGKCYRLFEWFGLGKPSDTVVYVYRIEGKKQRHVCVRCIDPRDELGWNYEGYTAFLRRVHSEVPITYN